MSVKWHYKWYFYVFSFRQEKKRNKNDNMKNFVFGRHHDCLRTKRSLYIQINKNKNIIRGTPATALPFSAFLLFVSPFFSLIGFVGCCSFLNLFLFDTILYQFFVSMLFIYVYIFMCITLVFVTINIINTASSSATNTHARTLTGISHTPHIIRIDVQS